MSDNFVADPGMAEGKGASIGAALTAVVTTEDSGRRTEELASVCERLVMETIGNVVGSSWLCSGADMISSTVGSLGDTRLDEVVLVDGVDADENGDISVAVR